MRFLLTRAGPAALLIAATMAFCSTADAASSWTAASTLGPTGREGGAPKIAVAPDGEAIATWVGSGRTGIQVSTRPAAGTWSPPLTIAPVREEVEGPEIAVSAGKAVIVWTDNIRTHGAEARVVLAVTRLRGKRWSKPQNISAEKRWREEPEGEAPQVAITRGGKAIAIWSAFDEGHSTTPFIKSATQAAKGAGWSAPVGLPGSIEGENPEVGATPAGETVAIWSASYDEESGLEVASRPAKGKWRSARRLSNPGAFAQPLLAVTSKGEAIGVWVDQSEDSIGATLQVATRQQGGASWKVKTIAPKSHSDDPSIVTETGGRVRVVWVLGPPFGEGGEVVSSTHTPGGKWTVPTSLAAEGLQIPRAARPQIVATGSGELVAAWQTGGLIGEGSTIEEASKPAGGVWSAPTQISTSPAPPQSGTFADLQLRAAPDGEAIATWHAYDGSGWVIEAATRPPAGSA
jgi:hypothetical protein